MKRWSALPAECKRYDLVYVEVFNCVFVDTECRMSDNFSAVRCDLKIGQIWKAQKVATGFHRNTQINQEGGIDKEQFRIDSVIDRVGTTGTVWLGLTVGCAQCHDHKFDPLTQEDFYQLFAFFNQTPVQGGGGDPQTAPNLATPTSEQTQRLTSLKDEIGSLDAQLSQMSKSLVSELPAWEKSERVRLAGASQWHQLRAEKVFASGSRVRTLSDNSVPTSAPSPDNDTYTLFASTDLSTVTGIRVEAMRHETMTQNSLSPADSGNFVLTELEVSLVESESDEAPPPLAIASAEATFEQGANKVTGAFDGTRRGISSRPGNVRVTKPGSTQGRRRSRRAPKPQRRPTRAPYAALSRDF